MRVLEKRVTQYRLVRTAVAASVLIHATGFAVLAAWTARAASSSVKLLGRKQVIQLTARIVEPQWTAEPLTLDLSPREASVLIEPREARIGKRHFVHVPTAQVPLADTLLHSETEVSPAIQRRASSEELIEVVEQSTPRVQRVQQRRPTPRVPELVSVPLPPSSLGNADQTPPDLSQNAPPTYPAYAIQQRWEGTVLLRIWVHETGRVTRVEVARSSGYRILDGAAATAVRQWTATPANRDGKPVGTVEVLPVRFKL